MFVVHVAKDAAKEDSIHEHVLLWDPNRFFGYSGAQSLEHALLGDVQGRPGDRGDLVLFDAALGVLVWASNTTRMEARMRDHQALRFFANSLRSLGSRWSALRTLTTPRRPVRTWVPTPATRGRRPLS